MIKICIIVKVNSNIHFLYLKSKVRFIWLQRIIESHRKYNGGEANSEEIVVQGIFFTYLDWKEILLMFQFCLPRKVKPID